MLGQCDDGDDRRLSWKLRVQLQNKRLRADDLPVAAMTTESDETPAKLVQVIRRAGFVDLVFAPIVGYTWWVIAGPTWGMSFGAVVAALGLYMVFGFKRVHDRLRRR